MSTRVLIVFFSIFLACTSITGYPSTHAAANTGKEDTLTVFSFKIRDKIDPRMSRHVNLALNQAKNQQADWVIINMDTYGGRLTDADSIRKRIMDFSLPVFVFINKNAASAGALISIACDSIYMTDGSSIGAATVVQGKSGKKAPDKYQSYMRSIMRSTAEANGRDPRIAEGMVDAGLIVDTISPKGQVITFSTSEAIQHGYCEGKVTSLKAIPEKYGYKDVRHIKFKKSGIEYVISFFLNPFISGILMLIMIGGVYFELQSPGIGFPIIAAAIATILYFIPYYLHGLAANWEILAFVAGVILIALEILVIPGFGIPGISGLILTVGSLVLIMLDNDYFDFSFVSDKALFNAMATTLAGIFGSLVIMIIGGVRLTRTPVFKRIAHQGTMQREEGYTSNFTEESLTGREGITHTVLRPSGKIMIDDEIYDAGTRGEFINKGEKVIVIDESGTSLKVKKEE